jgi:hypothetical protein
VEKNTLKESYRIRGFLHLDLVSKTSFRTSLENLVPQKYKILAGMPGVARRSLPLYNTNTNTNSNTKSE